MKKTVSIIMLSILCFLIRAQNIEIPKDYSLEKAEDYAPYQEKVIECMEWALNLKVDQNIELKQEVNAFILKWLTGSPNIAVIISSTAKPILDDKKFQYTSDLLMAYMCGMAIYQLKNPNEKDLIIIQEMGVEGVLMFYENNKEALKKSKAVAKYTKLKDKDELRNWLVEVNKQ